MKALLIIDMQLGSFRPYSLRHDTMGTVGKINTLSQHFRTNGLPVIFIQHDGTKENAFLPGTDDWRLLPELVVQPSDMIISKTANDSFYQTALAEVLTNNKITELFITGCATDFCIDTTVKSALGKDYNVTVIADAHTTADRPHIKAADLIQHHNWLWADMAATKYKISVIAVKDLLNS